ncbi:MAG: hypothetical protein QW255_05075 [Candidatus Bilamarchaeaceae archaeon]
MRYVQNIAKSETSKLEHSWDIDIFYATSDNLELPGIEIMKTRLRNITCFVPKGFALNNKIADLDVIENEQASDNGEVILNFVDFDDQPILNMIIYFANSKNKVVIPKLHLHILNDCRIPIKAYTFHNLVFENCFIESSKENNAYNNISVKFRYDFVL